MTKEESKPFLTLPEVQRYLGIKSRKTVLKYITSGRLPAYKIGGTRWRIYAEDVEKFVRGEIVKLSKKDKEENPSKVIS